MKQGLIDSKRCPHSEIQTYFKSEVRGKNDRLGGKASHQRRHIWGIMALEVVDLAI
jgi:hypothetical protein